MHCDVVNHSTMAGIRGMVHSLARHQALCHGNDDVAPQLALSFTPQVSHSAVECLLSEHFNIEHPKSNSSTY